MLGCSRSGAGEVHGYFGAYINVSPRATDVLALHRRGLVVAMLLTTTTKKTSQFCV